MLKLIRRISSDDGAVKVLFDHVRERRNLCSCFRRGSEASTRILTRGLHILLSSAIVRLLVVVVCSHFFVNQFHGMAKLRSVDYPSMAAALIMHTYSLP